MTPETEQTQAGTIEAGAADTGVDDGTYVPPLLLLVFGLPIFLVLIYFFLQFTRPDRFGRMDKHIVDALAREREGGDGAEEDEGDEDESDEGDEGDEGDDDAEEPGPPAS